MRTLCHLVLVAGAACLWSATAVESGDKVFVSYQGTGTTKDGKPVEAKGTWTLTGGTGKLKGVTGKGTYSCAPSADAFGCSGEGEYQLPK